MRPKYFYSTIWPTEEMRMVGSTVHATVTGVHAARIDARILVRIAQSEVNVVTPSQNTLHAVIVLVYVAVLIRKVVGRSVGGAEAPVGSDNQVMRFGAAAQNFQAIQLVSDQLG